MGLSAHARAKTGANLNGPGDGLAWSGLVWSGLVWPGPAGLGWLRSKRLAQPLTNSVTSGSGPAWRLQWPWMLASKDAPSGSPSAE